MTTAAPKRAPLAHLRAGFLAAGAFTLATAAQLVFGGPDGRWLAVHLFTAGVLTNLIATLAPHFAATLLHATERRGATARLVLLNLGAVLLVASRLRSGALLATGATLLTAAVLWLWWELRRMRRAAPAPGRFGFVVRAYQRATGAFVHGALLGVLMGTGALSGAWYASGRLAHLHVQALGWAGLTLLATLVFFGPTVLRRQIEPGADAAAAVALRRGATGLTVGVLALLASAVGGAPGTALRLLAAASLALYAMAVTTVCLPVLRGALRPPRVDAGGAHLAAVCAWFPLLAWADVGIVALARWAWLDAVGVALLIGVLAQSAMGALVALVPTAWGVGTPARARLRERLGAWPLARLVFLNALAVTAAVAAL